MRWFSGNILHYNIGTGGTRGKRMWRKIGKEEKRKGKVGRKMGKEGIERKEKRKGKVGEKKAEKTVQDQ